jgi:hypothetical protein
MLGGGCCSASLPARSEVRDTLTTDAPLRQYLRIDRAGKVRS